MKEEQSAATQGDGGGAQFGDEQQANRKQHEPAPVPAPTELREFVEHVHGAGQTKRGRRWR